MTVLTFPSNPTVGQQYAAPNGIQYVFDGVKWIVETTTSSSEAVSNSTQDRVAPMFVDGDNTGITFSYNAATNTMSATVTSNGNSLVNGQHEFTLGSDGNLTLPTVGNLLFAGGLIGPTELGVGVGIFGADPTSATTGGNIILQGGANYLESGGPTTTGGGITISAGQGSNDVDASNGGNVNITSGPASRYAGDIRIEGGGTYGSSGEGGNITIQSGSSISGVAGDITIQSGVGTGGGYLFEGLLKLRGKDAEIASANGSFSIKTGDVDSISNPPFIWEFDNLGHLTLPAGGSLAISSTVNIATNEWGNTAFANANTVIYTAKGTDLASIRVHASIEGQVDGDATGYHTQACDMMIVRRISTLGVSTVDSVVYGVIYTSTGPLATLDAQWNAISNKIEITATPVSTTNPVFVKIYATEVVRGD